MEFVPDGRRAALIGLRLRSTGRQRRVTVSVDAHSELMSAYPWGETMPSAADFNLPDAASADGGRLLFRDQGQPPVPTPRRTTGRRCRGRPRAPRRDRDRTGLPRPAGPGRGLPGDRRRRRRRCDDSAFGKGAGGQLRYKLTVPAGGAKTLWVAVAGSDEGVADARSEHDAALRDPEARARAEGRRARAARRRAPASSCPATRCSPQGIEWSQAEPGRLRAARRATSTCAATDEGKQYPPRRRPRAARALPRRRLPRLPVAVRHRRRVHRVRQRRGRASSSRSRTTCARCAT